MLNAPAVTVKFPVLSPVAVVVPSTNTSALSSQMIAALSPVDPLSNMKPKSFVLLLAPLLMVKRESLILVASKSICAALGLVNAIYTFLN